MRLAINMSVANFSLPAAASVAPAALPPPAAGLKVPTAAAFRGDSPAQRAVPGRPAKASQQGGPIEIDFWDWPVALRLAYLVFVLYLLCTSSWRCLFLMLCMQFSAHLTAGYMGAADRPLSNGRSVQTRMTLGLGSAASLPSSPTGGAVLPGLAHSLPRVASVPTASQSAEVQADSPQEEIVPIPTSVVAAAEEALAARQGAAGPAGGLLLRARGRPDLVDNVSEDVRERSSAL